MEHKPKLVVSTDNGSQAFSCVSIPLTQGQFALIDVADFPLVSRWKWYAFFGQFARTNFPSQPAAQGGS